jgi:hypothetical protein
VRNIRLIVIFLGLAALPLSAGARSVDDGPNVATTLEWTIEGSGLYAAQGGGMSLSDAIESVRRRGNVERIISAETKVSGGRETHHIKVLTKDGKVQTHKVAGRKLG